MLKGRWIGLILIGLCVVIIAVEAGESPGDVVISVQKQLEEQLVPLRRSSYTLCLASSLEEKSPSRGEKCVYKFMRRGTRFQATWRLRPSNESGSKPAIPNSAGSMPINSACSSATVSTS